MSLLDKVKFWKKDKPSFGDIKMDAPLGNFNQSMTPSVDTQDKAFGSMDPIGNFDSPQQNGFPEDNFSLPPPGLSHQPMHPRALSPPMQSSPRANQDMLSKDLEIISSKMDALRATLEAINQRLSNIEREVFEKKRGGW